MRDGWTTTTVGALVENFDSRRVPVKKSDRRPGPYPYYGASGVVDYVDGYLFDGEFLLVAEDGENLNTRKTPIAFLASGQFWVNNHAHIVRGKQSVDTRYLAYFLSASDVVDGFITGSAQPKLSQGNLHAIPLEIPPLVEREGIVRVLAALDDKIEANRALNETLETTCQALFRSWFVDFDPVVAKSEGRKPPHLSVEVAALFPSRLQETENGQLPEGWSVGKVGDIATNPKRKADPLRIAPDHPYIGLEHLPRRCVVLDAWGEASQVTSAKWHFRSGEILFGKLRPYFHKVGIALSDGICSTDILVVSPKDELHFGLLLGTLASPEFIDYADGTSGGTRQPRTSWRDMAKYPVPIPPKPLAAHLSRIVRHAEETFRANASESRTLAALRDAVLPRLLSGELRVRQAEKLVEEAI